VTLTSLSADSDVDEVTLDGRLFYTREAANGNARSPILEWRVGSTRSVEVDADLMRRRESMSATLWSLSARYEYGSVYSMGTCTVTPDIPVRETRTGSRTPSAKN